MGKARATRPAEKHGRTILFPRDILDRLQPHADRRSISVNELLRRLADTIAEDGMVDSVLDDDAALRALKVGEAND